MERLQHNNDMPDILVSQGTADEFFIDGQLLTDSLPSHPCIDIRMEEGYDHSYNFIATFMKDHVDYHAQQLMLGPLIPFMPDLEQTWRHM
jgi:S-formylglutathione hydrolase